MKFMFNYRKFALEYGPYIKEWTDKDKAGIFGKDNYEEIIAKLGDQIEEMHQNEENKDEVNEEMTKK